MAVAVPPAKRRFAGRPATSATRVGPVALGTTTLWLSLIVLLPLGALVYKAAAEGNWDVAFGERARYALIFTLLVSLACTAINAVMGTIIAFVLVRDDFPGKGMVNALIDLPFALPTIVAGLTLVALYGEQSPFGINIINTKVAVLLALLFVTLPFVVRSVQPVLIELDREMEEAAASLGASAATTFRRIILPNLRPAIISGCALSFARAVGEFGSLALISSNKAKDTEVASTYIFGQIESDAIGTAAAVSVILLGISMAVLLALRISERRGLKHEA